jgi:hypothetical protein
MISPSVIYFNLYLIHGLETGGSALAATPTAKKSVDSRAMLLAFTTTSGQE